MSATAKRPQRVILFGRHPDGREGIQVHRHGIPVNGGDPITAVEAAGWFSSAAPNWTPPTADLPAVQGFVIFLEELRRSEPLRLDTTHPAYKRLTRVKRAIITLLNDLPELIEGARRSREMAAQAGTIPWISDERAAAIETMYATAKTAEGSFHWRSSPRERDAPWHDAAFAIAWHAREVWRAAGRKKIIGAGGPLAELVVVALARIGDGEQSKEAIVKALRRHRGFSGQFSVPSG